MPATRRTATRVIALAALLALASTLAACDIVGSVTGPRVWTTETTLQDGSTQTITVRDTSGRITDVVFDPAGNVPAEITNPDGDLTRLLVPWTGGACDVETDIEWSAQGQGLKGTLKVQTSGDVCVMMAVQHVLELKLNTPVPAAQVTLDPVQ